MAEFEHSQYVCGAIAAVILFCVVRLSSIHRSQIDNLTTPRWNNIRIYEKSNKSQQQQQQEILFFFSFIVNCIMKCVEIFARAVLLRPLYTHTPHTRSPKYRFPLVIVCVQRWVDLYDENGTYKCNWCAHESCSWFRMELLLYCKRRYIVPISVFECMRVLASVCVYFFVQLELDGCASRWNKIRKVAHIPVLDRHHCFFYEFSLCPAFFSNVFILFLSFSVSLSRWNFIWWVNNLVCKRRRPILWLFWYFNNNFFSSVVFKYLISIFNHCSFIQAAKRLPIQRIGLFVILGFERIENFTSKTTKEEKFLGIILCFFFLFIRSITLLFEVRSSSSSRQLQCYFLPSLV